MALIFLDANVLFSSALGGATFNELWAAMTERGFTPCTSPQCLDEARRNVARKRPDAVERLEVVLGRLKVTDEPVAVIAGIELPEDDALVFAAAVESGSQVFLTGNTRHFGSLMTRGDLALRVATVRAWLDGV